MSDHVTSARTDAPRRVDLAIARIDAWTIVAVINVILLTALSTLGAMLYNVVASLVGGIKVSLMDE